MQNNLHIVPQGQRTRLGDKVGSISGCVEDCESSVRSVLKALGFMLGGLAHTQPDRSSASAVDAYGTTKGTGSYSWPSDNSISDEAATSFSPLRGSLTVLDCLLAVVVARVAWAKRQRVVAGLESRENSSVT